MYVVAVVAPSLWLLLWTFSVVTRADKPVADNCDLSEDLRKEIAGYRPIVKQVLAYVLDGPHRGRTWAELAEFTDTFGSRLVGTKNLENSIDYMLDKLKAAHLDNVHGEEMTFEAWQRGDESAWLISPRSKKLGMLGLGTSVGTPPNGINAEVVVVNSFDDLHNKSSIIEGKIVVYNQPYVSYGITAQYRSLGASIAAKYGAIAVLIRSITPFSLYTPHTGHQQYSEGIKKIPAACITIEDAEMLQRMYDRGNKIEILLKMNPKFFPNATSRNTVAEIKGTTKPERVLVVSGHLDSWDVGEGAMDDGGGAFVSWNSLVVLKELGLKPKRTIRCILWTAEEMGYLGANAYLEQHANELDNFDLVMESDDGTFTPYGLEFHGSDKSACIMKEVAKMFDSINATTVISKTETVGSDIDGFQRLKVPGLSLMNKNEKYFWYHHTQADTMAVEDPDALDLNTAMYALVSYIVADLSIDLPRYT
ncbi:carboxypeptidase Q-like isoform X2 [Adelges cooleyi]|nr:carboxypeptidase Q-like isoform X2 [Adelges cooleyi]